MNIGFTFKFQTYYINQMERILIKYILIPGCIPFYKMLKKKKKFKGGVNTSARHYK